MAAGTRQFPSMAGLMSMTQPLRTAAISTPDKIATRFGARDQTWAEVHWNVSRLAAALQALGLKTGDRAAILALNSDRYSEYQWATWWAGGCVVPMNARWTAAENAYSLRDSGAEILFVDSTFAPLLPAIREETPDLKHVIYLGDDAAPEGMLSYMQLIAGHDPVADAMRSGEDLAGLYYTGGTTGFPKGVMLPHRALSYNALTVVEASGIEPDDIYIHAAPMFHLADGALSGAASAVGAQHAYLSVFDPEKTLAAIERYQATHVLLVPTMLAMILQIPDLDVTRLSSLKLLMYGASPMPEGVLRKAMEMLPDVNFAQGYGQTELAPVVAILSAEDHALERCASERLKSAGKAVPGVEIAIFDEKQNALPNGIVGEIAVQSPGAMLGYWHLPEQTAAAMKDGWILTGDAGCRDDDGFIFVVDRIKDMIVTGGENVFCAEVESVLSTHPAIAEVAIIGVPAEQWGEVVHAIVVLKDEASVSEAALIEHCRPQLAKYKLPSSVSFRDEPLPLSATGKVLKRLLREPHWASRDSNVG